MVSTEPVLPSAKPVSCSPAAERMRRHRQRRRSGLRCLTIELYETEVDALIQKGLLKPETRCDPFAITEALYEHLKHTLVKCRDAQLAT